MKISGLLSSPLQEQVIQLGVYCPIQLLDDEMQNARVFHQCVLKTD
jgi:hypothetical protein